ncbi:MAG: hypothetical protein FJ119_03030 [Deltaproteobacteria bacterium]|nr:hypothetical protein [Deltaproteobacteria bacterium]
MKTISSICALFVLLLAAPLYAGQEAGPLCDPKKAAECNQKLGSLMQSIDSLRAKVLAAQSELAGGKQLTEAEANQLLKRVDEINRNMPAPPSEGMLWDK